MIGTSVICLAFVGTCFAVPPKSAVAPAKPGATTQHAAVKSAELEEAEFPVSTDHPIHKTGAATVGMGTRVTGQTFNSDNKKLEKETEEIKNLLNAIVTEKKKKTQGQDRAECYFDEEDLKVPELEKYLQIPPSMAKYPLCFWGGMKTEKAIDFIENPANDKANPGLDCIRLESTTFGYVLVSNFKKDMDLKKLPADWNKCHCHEPEFWGTSKDGGEIDKATLKIKQMPLWKALWTLGSRAFARNFKGQEIIAVFNSMENHREKAPYGNTFKSIELPVLKKYKETDKSAFSKFTIYIVNEQGASPPRPKANNQCPAEKDEAKAPARATEEPHVYKSCDDEKLKNGLKAGVLDDLGIKMTDLTCHYKNI